MKKIIAFILMLLVCIESNSSYRLIASSPKTNSIYSIELYFDSNGGKIYLDNYKKILNENMLPYKIPGGIIDSDDSGTYRTDAVYYKSGYTLKSWNTKADGTGKNYYPGDLIYSLSDLNEDTQTLYAIWEEDEPDAVTEPSEPTPRIMYWDLWLKLNGNGIAYNDEVHFGGKAVEPWFDDCYQEISYTFPEPELLPEFDGQYTFKYWSTEPDGSGKTFEAGYVVHFLSELGTQKLYAIWDTADSGRDKNANIDTEKDIDSNTNTETKNNIDSNANLDTKKDIGSNTNIDTKKDIGSNTIVAKKNEPSLSIMLIIIFSTAVAAIIIGIIVLVKKKKNISG